HITLGIPCRDLLSRKRSIFAVVQVFAFGLAPELAGGVAPRQSAIGVEAFLGPCFLTILVVLLLHQNAVSVRFHKAVVLTVYQGSDFQWPPLRIELTVWAMTTAVYVIRSGNELPGLVVAIVARITPA